MSRSDDGWTVTSTGETQVSCFLQVCDDAALVPQQAAVAQLDGGNELAPTGLGFVPGPNENTANARFVSRHFLHLLRRWETIKIHSSKTWWPTVEID